MTTDPRLNPERRIPEAEARDLIERALDLAERRQGSMTLSEIQSVLSEMGVPSDIQHEAIHGTDVVDAPDGRRAMPTAAECGTFGIAIGAACATAMPFVPQPLVVVPAMLGVGVMFSGVVAARAHLRDSAGRARFHWGNTLAWGGMGAAFVTVTQFAQTLLAGSSVHLSPWVFPAAWVFTGVTGMLLTRYESPVDGDIGRRSVLVRAVKRAATKIRTLIASLVHRVTGPALQHRPSPDSV